MLNRIILMGRLVADPELLMRSMVPRPTVQSPVRSAPRAALTRPRAIPTAATALLPSSPLPVLKNLSADRACRSAALAVLKSWTPTTVISRSKLIS